jgi:hypothetical protein
MGVFTHRLMHRSSQNSRRHFKKPSSTPWRPRQRWRARQCDISGASHTPLPDQRAKVELSEEEVIKKLKRSAWYKALSEKVKNRVNEYPPTKRYRMKTTGRIVTLVSYDQGKNGDCNSVTVDISRQDNPGILFEREVFGVRFDELEPINTLKRQQN